jgi:hypothetical protein
MAALPVLLLCHAAAQQSAKPELSTIVQGLEKTQSEQRRYSPYQVIREYQLFATGNSTVDAKVVARLDFQPPASKQYGIQEWTGSSRGKQIVQRILDHEVEPGRDDRTRALTRDNYDFVLVGETISDNRSCYVLALKPRRKESDLISGLASIEKSSFRIVHIEGELAKAPSWWVKGVRVKLSFGDASGAWLQTNMEAVADVRFLGRHTLTSHILDYRGTDFSASTISAPRVPRYTR